MPIGRDDWMLEDKKMFKKLNLSRKKIMSQIISEIVGGILLGLACYQAISIVHKGVSLALCIIVFVMMIIFLCTPLWMPIGQIYDMDMACIKVIPPYTILMKWKLILHILCRNDISNFIETISLSSIYYGKFSVDRRYAGWGFHNYTYILTLYMDDRDIALVINPMENGLLMPSGKGGFVFEGYKNREDICNIINYFEINQIKINDPYQIVVALKNPDIVIYDYLEQLDIKIRY